MERGMETVPGHISELQRQREACGGLGVMVSDSQFIGITMLSMPTPSWDQAIGTLGRVLDPKVIISHLNMEWSGLHGPTSSNKNPNIIFQSSSRSHVKCDNCSWTGHQRQQARGSVP